MVKPPKLREMEIHIGQNFFQDIANEINGKFCLKSLDNMSKKLLQNVQKLDTEKFGGVEDRV